jgi:hypothetical protein
MAISSQSEQAAANNCLSDFGDDDYGLVQLDAIDWPKVLRRWDSCFLPRGEKGG